MSASRRHSRDEDELDQVVGEDVGRASRSAEEASFPPSKSHKSSSRARNHPAAVPQGGAHPKGIVQESKFPSLKTIYLQSRTSLNPVWLWGQGMRTLMLHRSTWSAGLPYLIVGLILAFIGEVMPHGPQYNVVTLVVLMAAFAFPNFPDKTVRPQLVICLITCLSFFLDVSLFANPQIDIGVKAITAMVFLAKGLALYQFLWYTKNAAKARKYFIRRVRVFLIPWARPKNIMREMRSRILAIELLQFAAIIAYMTLFFIAIVHLGYLDLVTGPKRGVALAAFLPLKTVSSGLVFYGLFTDTDAVLCLAHFGILGGCMKSVKAYVRKKFEEYEGWPLAYGLNKYRFYVITFLKFVDWCWGLAGWAALGTYFGNRYYGLGDNVRAFVVSCAFILAITDLYIPLLFGVVYWLMGENKHRLDVIVREHKESGEMVAEFDDGDHASDDSELDDFGFRAAVESRDVDVEQSAELGRAKGAFSPDRFAKASRVDYSRSVRWDEDDEELEKKKKRKKKKHKSRKHKKHHRLETDSDEEELNEEESDDKFLSTRNGSNVAETRLQSLVDDDTMPRYMREKRGGRPAGLDESEGAETTIEFANAAPAPPARGSSFTSPRLSAVSPPMPGLHQAVSPPVPGPRAVIKVPPLQFRRSASTNETDAKFSRPLLGSQNSLDMGATNNPNKSNSISVGKGEDVLDWRSPNSPMNRRTDAPESPVERYDGDSSLADELPIPSDIAFVSKEISAEEYSSMWDTLETALASEYELSASSALSQEEMLVVIMEHLQSNGFGIAASGIIDRALTVFSYASADSSQIGARQPETCLIEIKLKQLSDGGDGGKLHWQLEFICKCTVAKLAAAFLRRMQLHLLLGSDEISFDDLL